MRRPDHAGAPTAVLRVAARLERLGAHLVPGRGGTHAKGRGARHVAAIVTITTAVVLGLAGTAFAYFAASATGTSAAKAQVLTPPSTLKAKASAGSSGRVVVSWKASTTLPKLTPGPPKDGYWIFRSTTSFTGTRLTTTSPDLLLTGGCQSSKTEGSKATSCTDTTVTPGTTYHYAVEAVYDDWISLPVADPAVTTPSAPTATTVTATATPSEEGGSVTFTATISSSYTGATPTGTITFSEKPDGGSTTTISGCSGLALGATSPDQLTCTTTLSNSGSPYTIEATFTSTSPTFAGSSGTKTQSVMPSPPPVPPNVQPGGATVTPPPDDPTPTSTTPPTETSPSPSLSSTPPETAPTPTGIPPETGSGGT